MESKRITVTGKEYENADHALPGSRIIVAQQGPVHHEIMGGALSVADTEAMRQYPASAVKPFAKH